MFENFSRVNGFVVIGRRKDGDRPDDVILGVRAIDHYRFEYVTSRHRLGDKEWHAGHYFTSISDATADFETR